MIFHRRISAIVFWSILLLAALNFTYQPAQAGSYRHIRGRKIFDWGTNWQPPRGEARLNWMSSDSSKIRWNLQGVCYDVLEKDKKPYYLYLAAGLRFRNHILEPVGGWAWQDKEWVTGLRIYSDYRLCRTYYNLEYQPQSQSFYYLAQLEFRFSPFLEMGFEAEGWGDVDDDIQSNGAGVNASFNLHGLSGWKVPGAKVSVEMSVQYRELGGLWKPQAIARLVITPKRGEHSSSTRRDRSYRR